MRSARISQTAPQHLIRRAVEEIWNNQHLAVADDLFAVNYRNHGGLITDLVEGPEAIKSSVVLYRRAFPDLYLLVEHLTSAEGMTVLHWRAHACQPEASTEAIAAASQDGFAGIFRAWTAAGQIQESWTEWDQAAAYQRLGLGAAPGTAATGGWS